MAGARAWILDQLDAERSRWMLWLPVALGLGIAIYFELPSEPALWLGPALAAAALALVFFAPAGSLARAVAIGRYLTHLSLRRNNEPMDRDRRARHQRLARQEKRWLGLGANEAARQLVALLLVHR